LIRLQLSSSVLAWLTVAVSLGLAPAHSEDAPEDIAEIIAEAAQVCRAAGGKPDTAAILRGDDLNGDGGSDWIADFAKLTCEGADNPACNANGCTLQLYFRDGGEGWDLVFEDFVKSYKFSSSGDTRTMHVTTSGIPCNKPAVETCSYNYRLNKEAVMPVQ
jgi:hypothetical protein